MSTAILKAESQRHRDSHSLMRDGAAFGVAITCPSTHPHFLARLVGWSICSCALSGCYETQRTASSRAATCLLLDATPAEIDFGTLPPNAQKKSSFALSNSGSTPVEIARIDSSCSCVRARLTQFTVPPGEKVGLEVDLDLREEPNFAGGLLVEVTGKNTEGHLAFSVRISMTVGSERGS